MPYLTTEATSAQRPEELSHRLREVTEPLKFWYGFKMPQKNFVGRIGHDSFRIMKAIGGRDSFNPVLHGHFLALEHGTRIRITMTFHPLTWLFMIAWTGATGYGAFRGLFRAPLTGVNLGALFMLSVLWAMAIPFFVSDAREARRLLGVCLGVTFGA